MPMPKQPIVTRELQLPSEEELLGELRALASKEEAVAKCLGALETGTFHHPDGRTDDLGMVRLVPSQAGLLAWLARNCPAPISVEVGFGMGSSAAVILGARRQAGKKWAHFIYDPFGLPNGRGTVVESFLKQCFPKGFQRVHKRSEIGLAELLDKRGPGTVGLNFIDGGHRFENVMVDFVLADQLCCIGGYIVLDDALFPAIESVVNYIQTNRPDYAVAPLVLPNCTVIKKIEHDRRTWDAFSPFEVPDRHDWEAKANESHEGVIAAESEPAA